MTFDHVYINGDGHLALRKTSTQSVDVTINNLHGDLTGLVHTSVDQKISIVDSDSPIPASFRVYDTATITLPAGTYNLSLIVACTYSLVEFLNQCFNCSNHSKFKHVYL